MQSWRRAATAGLAACALSWAGQALADVPKAVVEGVDDGALRAVLVAAVGESERAPTSRFEARRRARQASEAVVAALRSEGYYGHQVVADVEGGEQPGETARAVVRVTPGRRFSFKPAVVQWVGDPPGAPALGSLAEQPAVTPGDPGRSAEVLAGEGRVIAALQQAGYPDATAEPREVVVDHADASVAPTFRIRAGQLVRLDGVQVSTQGRTNPAWVGMLAPWREGAVYDPDDVAELERRLQDVGVYESVAVALAPQDDARGLRPVVVSLAERKPRTLELGASYSTAEGIGLDNRLTLYNRFRRADTTTFTARLAEIDSRLDVQLRLPHWRRAQQTLTLGTGLFRDDTKAYNETRGLVRGDVTRRYGRASYVTAGASLDAARIREPIEQGGVVVVGRTRKLVTGALLGAVYLDRSNDLLSPTRGWRLDVRAEPTLSTGDDGLAYVRSQAQTTAYLPLGESAGTVLAGRLRLGAIFGGRVPSVPASRRFFAGGGGSVRGYAYQDVGPRLIDGTPQGGLSLAEASFEVRQRITSTVGVVGFVDAGSVGTRTYPDFKDSSLGVGLGVRYDLGFAPIRADIAVPLNKRSGDAAFQVYLSIGQSF